jgi:hypothetical protein
MLPICRTGRGCSLRKRCSEQGVIEMQSRELFAGSFLRRVSCIAMVTSVCAAPVHAQKAAAEAVGQEAGRTALAVPVGLERIENMAVTIRPSGGELPTLRGPGCPPMVASHTGANFAGGTFNAQGGFAENEIAAVSYVLPADAFPIKVDLLEFIMATSAATVQTTTEYTVLVWDGPPSTGTQVFEYSSNDIDLPHARIGPGTAGLNIQVSIDPGDPEQIYVYNTGGTNTFSIGLRIDQHNNQTANPCFTAPPSGSNAFPCTDVDGLAQSARNWLFAVNCGSFGCPPNGGWTTFAGLISLCRPTGDWVMRATWSSVNCTTDPTGPCCVSGSCSIQTEANCTASGGSWTLGGSCSPNPCPSTTGACCFGGGTCQVLDPAVCTGFGGTFIGLGVLCGPGDTCPLGACCMPDGSCVAGLSSPACTGMGGAFQGVGTTCSPNNCPQPVGACCSSTNFCFPLTQASCNGIPGATWQGPLTSCEPNPCGAAQTGACCIGGTCVVVTEAECVGANSRFAGIGTACNEPGNNTQPCCRADFNQDDTVAVPDIFAFLAAWFAGDASANFDGVDPSPSVPDIFAFLSAWFAGCG